MASCFSLVCLLHSASYIVFGFLMMFYLREISSIGHREETASKLVGSTPDDQLLISTAEALAGMFLFTIGILLFMVALVKDREFQSFFARGCILIHFLMGLWRLYFERKVSDLARDWPRQFPGDFI